MKHLIWIAGLLFLLSACGTKDEPQAVTEEPAAQDESAAAEAVAEDAAGAAVEETLEVVEESAAVEEEDDNEPIVLAMAEEPAPMREWKFREGPHYSRMVPTQPTVGGADKVEVAEIFNYSCPHCFNQEAYFSRWASEANPGIRVVRIPAPFNRLALLHAQIYYTHEILARNGTLAEPEQFHRAVFAEFHQRGNRLTSEGAIQKLFERFGVSAADFDKAWNSFEVNQKLRVAADLTRRYGVDSVPTVVVNGKYRTSASQVGSYETLFEVIDELTAREGIR